MFRWMKVRTLGRLNVELAGLVAEQAADADLARQTGECYPHAIVSSARDIARVKEQIRQIHEQLGRRLK